ncbi:hypothetical protein INS49_009634 [Diaporthe citri]|uniref:uncharacterized protein n=1 Tax=Diaporthe citri TaxID=83186 RepID=UPI001C820CAC|nr:uncharacterized protein INS49_009634 [Diaporthe citri]KAG6361407.1 hypothetical protein INS49_009634 [Diaporthe citri]
MDDAPLIIREQAGLEPYDLEPNGPTVHFFARMKDTVRGHIVAMISEFLGTFMFLFFSYAAAQIGNEKEDSLPLFNAPAGLSLLQISYIASVFGLSLGVNVWIFYRVSGGMFNPAVAIGLWIAGAFDWVRLVCVIPVQFLGAITAAGVVSALLPGKLQAENSLSSGTLPVQGLFLEVILTAELVMTIIMLAVEKSRTSFIAPLAIGFALFVAHLIGINYTGTSVNPARSLGPAVVNNNYVDEIWIFFVGPILGAVVAAALYHLLKAMGYETANPGQDDDGLGFYRIVHQPTRPIRPRRRSSDNLYNTYLQDMTSPRTRMKF